MFKRFVRSLWTNKPLVTPEEKEEIIGYHEKIIRITAIQTQEADRYNTVLMIHMNSIDDQESINAMLDASEKLALSSKECIQHHAELTLVPDLAKADYVAWGLLYQDYSVWANATHDALIALSQGRTPIATRVRELFDASEKQRMVATRASRNLLQSIGLTGQDLQRFMAAGQDTDAR